MNLCRSLKAIAGLFFSMIKFRQFKPCGIYLKDIKEYTGYSDVIGACKKAGVVLWRLRGREYAPISLQDTYKVLRVIRTLQGQRFLRYLEQSNRINGLVK